jgi:hypothetical protein
VLGKGFMSEVWEYERILLGKTEAYFLGLISVHKKTTYEIFSYLRRETLEGKKSMAYKNVHKRVKRLEELGLIEPIGKIKRGAIPHRLTSRGLYQRILLSESPFDNTPPVILNRKVREANPIIQTILYQFFEVQTIEILIESLGWDMILADYLRETCEAILKQLEEWRSIPVEYNDNMDYVMDHLITVKAKNFINQMVISFKRDQLNGLDLTQDRDPYKLIGGQEEVNLIRALSKYKKFITNLIEMRDDFYGGCEIFL